MEERESFSVWERVGSGFARDKEGMAPDDPGEGATTWDLNDGRQPGSPRRDQHVQSGTLGLLTQGQTATLDLLLIQGVHPRRALFGEGIRTYVFAPGWTHEFAQQSSAFVRPRLGSVQTFQGIQV